LLALAGRTNAVEKYLVSVRAEACRSRPADVESASGKFKDAIACPAVKVMVVASGRSFVERTLLRMGKAANPSGGDHDMEVAVDGCTVQGWYELLTSFENLIHAQGALCCVEHRMDGASLIGMPLHRCSYAQGLPLLAERIPQRHVL